MIVFLQLTGNSRQLKAMSDLSTILHASFEEYRVNKVSLCAQVKSKQYCHIMTVLLIDALCEAFKCGRYNWYAGIKHKKTLPKSEHMTCDVCVCVVKTVITNRSPGVVVVDLKTSSIRQSVVTSKSNRHYTRTTAPANVLNARSSPTDCQHTEEKPPVECRPSTNKRKLSADVVHKYIHTKAT